MQVWMVLGYSEDKLFIYFILLWFNLHLHANGWYLDIISQRESCVTCRRKPFSQTYNEWHYRSFRRKWASDIWWEWTKIQSQSVRCLLGVLLCCSWLCIMCIKSMEPPPFDSPVETDIVRRFPTSAKVFVSTSASTRTRDLPHSNCTL